MQSLWMLVASFMFAIMGAGIKISAEYDASLAQIVLFRGLPSVICIFAWAQWRKRSLRPVSWKAHLLRNLFGVTSMWAGFFALTNLSLSTAVSLNYTGPLFIGIWMVFLGGMRRDFVRVFAVLLGFVGVIAVLRPSISEDQWFAATVGLASGACSAVAMMQIRQLGKMGESEWRTVFWFSVFVCLSSIGGLGIHGWHDLPWQGWLALLCVGVAGLGGQLAMTRAFGAGSPLLSAALQYSTIIFASLLSIVIWADVPDLLAWLGMALVIASGMLSSWRTYTESKLLRGETAAKSN